MHIKSLLILSFTLAGAFASWPGSRKNRRNICLTSCGAGARTAGYVPGWEYTYTYHGASTTKYLEDKLKDSSSFFIDAEITIETISNCQMALHVSQAKIMVPNEKQNKEDKDLAMELQKNILFFRFEDGFIDDLCSEDPLWVRNIKRGMLSTFHDMSNFPFESKIFHSGVVNDIEGRCGVTYTWKKVSDLPRIERCSGSKCWKFPPLDVSNKEYVVTTSKDPSTCDNHQRIFSGLQSTSYRSDSPNRHLPVTEPPSRCNYAFKSGIISHASCEQSVQLKSALRRTVFSANTHLVKVIEFKKKTQQTCGSGCRQLKRSQSQLEKKRFHISNLQFEFTDVEGKVNGELSKAKELLCKVAAGKSDTSINFMKLVEILRTRDGSKLLQQSTMSCKDISPGVVKKVLLDAAQMAGTSEAVRHIMKTNARAITDADNRLASFIFVKKPSLKLLYALKGFVRKYKKFPRAAKASTGLFCRYCQSRKSCQTNKVIRSLVTFLGRELTKQCSLSRSKLHRGNALKLITVAGNFHINPHLQMRLMKCAMDTQSPTIVRVTAVNSLRSCLPQRSRQLLKLLHRSGDTAVRIAAYKTLLQCPQQYAYLRLIANLMRRERDQQVAAYVQSHIISLKKTLDPTLQDLRKQVKHIRWSFPRSFRTNYPVNKLSRNFQDTYYSQDANVGVKMERDVIRVGREFMPRHVSTKASAFLFGQRLDLYEVIQNLERGSLRDQRQLRLRMFGHDILDSYFNGYFSLKPTPMHLLRKFYKLDRRNPKSSIDKRMLIMDSTLVMSTSLGVPLQFKLTGATALKIDGELELKHKKPITSLSGKLKSHFDLAFGLEMNVALKNAAFGVKKIAAGQHMSSIQASVKHISYKNELEFEMLTPERIDILSLGWKQNYIVRGSEVQPKTVKMTDSLSRVFNDRLQNALGYQIFAVRSNVGTVSKRNSGGLKLYMQRMDKHNKFVINARYSRSIIYLFMDTPGSIIDRKLFGELKDTKDGFICTLEAPWRKLNIKVESRYRYRPFYESQVSIAAKTEDREHIDVAFSYTRQRSNREAIAKAKFGDITLLDAKLSHVVKKDGPKFDLMIKQPFREPVSLLYDVKVTKENRISIGRHYKGRMTLKSPFLKTEVSGKADISRKFLRSKWIVSYEIPNSYYKGTVGAKLSWNRQKKTIYLDTLKAALAFSQFPHLDVDVTLKSTFVSWTNFRHDLLLKYGEQQIPLSSKVDFAFRRGRSKAESSLKFQCEYSIPRHSSGVIKFKFSKSRRIVDTSTKLKIEEASQANPIIDFTHGFRYRRDWFPLAEGSLHLSSRYLKHQIVASTTLGNGKLPHVGKMRFDLKKRNTNSRHPLSVMINLQPRSVILRAKAADWLGNFTTTVQKRRGLSVTYSFVENSRHQLQGSGGFLYSSKLFRISNIMLKRSRTVYNVTVQTSYKRRVPKGLLDIVLAKSANVRRIKVFFSQERKLHLSQLLIETKPVRIELLNNYSFSVQPFQQAFAGKSDLSIRGKVSDRYLLTTEMTRKSDSIDLYSGLKINEKDHISLNLGLNPWRTRWMTFGCKGKVSSSFPMIKNFEFSHLHNLQALSLSSSTKVSYSRLQFALDIDGKIDPNLWKLEVEAKCKNIFITKINHQFIPSENKYIHSVATQLQGRGRIDADLTTTPTSVKGRLYQSLSVERFPKLIEWIVDPQEKVAFKTDVGDYTGNLAYIVASSDLKADISVLKPNKKSLVSLKTLSKEWQFLVDLKDFVPFNANARLSKRFCDGSVSTRAGPKLKEFFSVIASFCDLRKQKLNVKWRDEFLSYRYSSKSSFAEDSTTSLKLRFIPAIFNGPRVNLKTDSRSVRAVEITSFLTTSEGKSVRLTTQASTSGREIANLQFNFKTGKDDSRSVLKTLFRYGAMKSKLQSSWEKSSYASALGDHEFQFYHPSAEFLSKAANIGDSFKYEVSVVDPDTKNYHLRSAVMTKDSGDININLDLKAKERLLKFNAEFAGGPPGYKLNINAAGTVRLVTGETAMADLVNLSMKFQPGFNLSILSPYLSSKVTITRKFQAIIIRPGTHYKYKGKLVGRMPITPSMLDLIIKSQVRNSAQCTINFNVNNKGINIVRGRIIASRPRNPQEKYKGRVEFTNGRFFKYKIDLQCKLQRKYDCSHDLTLDIITGRRPMRLTQQTRMTSETYSRITKTMTGSMPRRLHNHPSRIEFMKLFNLRVFRHEMIKYTVSPAKGFDFRYKLLDTRIPKNRRSLDIILNPQTVYLNFTTPKDQGYIRDQIFKLVRSNGAYIPDQFYLRTQFPNGKGLRGEMVFVRLSMNKELAFRKRSYTMTANIDALPYGQLSNRVKPKYHWKLIYQESAKMKNTMKDLHLINMLWKRSSVARVKVNVFHLNTNMRRRDIEINLFNQSYSYGLQIASKRDKDTFIHQINYLFQKEKLLVVTYGASTKQGSIVRTLKIKPYGTGRPFVVSTKSGLTNGNFRLSIGNGDDDKDFVLSLNRSRMPNFSFRVRHKMCGLDINLNSKLIDGKNIITLTTEGKVIPTSKLYFQLSRERIFNQITKTRLDFGNRVKSVRWTGEVSYLNNLVFNVRQKDSRNQITFDMNSKTFQLRHELFGDLKYQNGRLTFERQGKSILNFQCKYLSSKITVCSYDYNPQLLFNEMRMQFQNSKAFIQSQALPTATRFVNAIQKIGSNIPRLTKLDQLLNSLRVVVRRELPMVDSYGLVRFPYMLRSTFKQGSLYLKNRIEVVSQQISAVSPDNMVSSVRRRIREMEAIMQQYQSYPRSCITRVGRSFQRNLNNVILTEVVDILTDAGIKLYDSAINSVQVVQVLLEPSVYSGAINYMKYSRYLDSRLKEWIFDNKQVSEMDQSKDSPALLTELLGNAREFWETQIATPEKFRVRLERFLQTIAFDVASPMLKRQFESFLLRSYSFVEDLSDRTTGLRLPKIEVADAASGRYRIVWYHPGQCRPNDQCVFPPLIANPVKLTKSVIQQITNRSTGIARGRPNAVPSLLTLTPSGNFPLEIVFAINSSPKCLQGALSKLPRIVKEIDQILRRRQSHHARFGVLSYPRSIGVTPFEINRKLLSSASDFEASLNEVIRTGYRSRKFNPFWSPNTVRSMMELYPFRPLSSRHVIVIHCDRCPSNQRSFVPSQPHRVHVWENGPQNNVFGFNAKKGGVWRSPCQPISATSGGSIFNARHFDTSARAQFLDFFTSRLLHQPSSNRDLLQ